MASKQFVRLDLQYIRKPLDRVQRRRINLPLKRRHISSIDVREIGQLLLRQRPLGTYPAEVRGEDLPQLHEPKQTLASTLHPRSILYTFVPCVRYGSCVL